MLKIKEFIDCFDDLNEANKYLRMNLNIDRSEHVVFDDDMFMPVTVYKPAHNADMDNPLVREAHCLVLDVNGEMVGKAWDHPDIITSAKEVPSDFDFGNKNMAEEMPDGEIVIIYNVEGVWSIGIKDNPIATEYLPGVELPGFTYEHEIKSFLTKRFGRWTKPFENTNPFMCFIFSYVNPYAKRVMPAISEELYLMGIMNMENGTEFTPGLVDTTAQRFRFARPHWSEVNGTLSLFNRFNNLRALSPGVMLRDMQGGRVILANPIYTTVKNALEAGERVSSTHIAKILCACRDKADLITLESSYPDYGPMLRLLWDVRIDLWQELVGLWNSVDREDLREFAKGVMHHPFNYILFKFKDKRTHSIKEEVENIDPKKLAKVAKEKWEKEFDAASKLIKFAGGSTDDSSEKEDGTYEI